MTNSFKIHIISIQSICDETLVQMLTGLGHSVHVSFSISDAKEYCAVENADLYVISVTGENVKDSFLFLSENEHTKKIPAVASVTDSSIIGRLAELSSCHSVCINANQEAVLFNVKSALRNLQIFSSSFRTMSIDNESFFEITHKIEDAIWITELSAFEKVIFVNHSFEKIFGRQRYELLANPLLWIDAIIEGDVQKVTNEYIAFKSSGLPKFKATFRIFDVNNNIKWIQARCWKTEFLSGKPSRITMLMQDITANISFQEDLRIKNHAIESAITGITITNSYGKIFFANNAFLQLWKFNSDDEVIGKSLLDLIGGANDKEIIIETILKQGGWIGEITALSPDGENFPVQASLTMVTDDNSDPIAIMASFIDISEMKSAQLEIKQNLEEKKYLLSELKHRVKNSLNLVSSLIAFEISKGKIDIDDLKKIRTRILSISSLYISLDMETSASQINIKNYIQDIISGLQESYIPENKKIRIELNAEDITADPRISMSIGLIINEIITNSLKHAFNIKTQGTISVIILQSENKIIIDVSNDGDDFPENYSIIESKGLGMKIINMLTEQHKGSFEFIRGKRPHFIIKIPFF